MGSSPIADMERSIFSIILGWIRCKVKGDHDYEYVTVMTVVQSKKGKEEHTLYQAKMCKRCEEMEK